MFREVKSEQNGASGLVVKSLKIFIAAALMTRCALRLSQNQELAFLAQACSSEPPATFCSRNNVSYDPLQPNCLAGMGIDKNHLSDPCSYASEKHGDLLGHASETTSRHTEA